MRYHVDCKVACILQETSDIPAVFDFFSDEVNENLFCNIRGGVSKKYRHLVALRVNNQLVLTNYGSLLKSKKTIILKTSDVL